MAGASALAGGEMELDADRLPKFMGSMFGLWIVLVLSTWLGVAICAALVAVAAFASSALTLGLGLLFWIPVFAATTALSGAILLFGAVILPLAASISAYLKLRCSRALAIGDWALVGLPPDHPLTQTLQKQAERLGLQKCPSMMTIPDTANALAIHASHQTKIVAIGEPFLEHLTREEIEAIVGHELGHIVSGDAQRKIFAIEFQEYLSWFLMFNGLKKAARCFFTFIAEIMIHKLSRHREYYADAIGAALTSKEAMISALNQIHAIDFKHTRKEMLQSEHMFIGVGRLFKTHPTVEQRVRALESEQYLRMIPWRPRRPLSLDTDIVFEDAHPTFRTGI